MATGDRLISDAALVPRWFELVRHVLPSMATSHRWPISADHCFMRVCLDVSLAAAWPSVVRAPAYRHLTDAQLAAAVAIAEGVLAEPGTLPELNRRSRAMRRVWRAAGAPKARGSLRGEP